MVYSPLQKTKDERNKPRQIYHNENALDSISSLYFWKKKPAQKKGNKKLVAAKSPKGITHKTMHDNRHARTSFLISLMNRYVMT
jgi:hypothetical protein